MRAWKIPTGRLEPVGARVVDVTNAGVGGNTTRALLDAPAGGGAR